MTLDDLERPIETQSCGKNRFTEPTRLEILETNCTGTVGFYCLLVLKIYKRKNKMFAFDETKELSLLNAHICTRKYMYVVIICNYSSQHKKSKKKQSDSESVISQVFVLYFIFVPISSFQALQFPSSTVPH